MSLRRIVLGLVVVAIVIVAGGMWWAYRPELAPRAGSEPIKFSKESIERGGELSLIANCADCHTVPGKPSYSGGLPIGTPFGKIYAANLTPDRETGIGAWTEEAFRRSMRQGVDRIGRQLYPAFPYDHFTFTTDEDIHRIFAFLMTRPAVANKVPENQLEFPFNIRPLVAAWKLLYLRQEPIQPVASQSEEWNRGRYLVEGLGHCGSCHTPRNALGAEEKARRYAGGTAGGWTAPPLNASLVAAHRWTADGLADYLSTGWQRNHGAAAGPMADVAKNLGRVSEGDVRAIATYIASLSAQAPVAKVVIPKEGRNVTGASPVIAAIYEGACAECHNARQDVGPSQALSLGLSTAVQGPTPANAVRAIMNGIKSYRVDGGPYMPGFDRMLTDSQIVELTQYVRARYSEQPAWSGVEAEVVKVRKEATQP